MKGKGYREMSLVPLMIHSSVTHRKKIVHVMLYIQNSLKSFKQVLAFFNKNRPYPNKP